jgi:UDPglucose 6-dehydrogenase
VTPGTNEEIKKIVKDFCGHENFDIVSNPEFLREGSAIDDFFQKNPIVLGSDSEKALGILETLYQPLIDKGRVLIKTNFATAELIKYAWNAFSAIKITYVNELSFLCNKTHADIVQLVFGMSFSDELLPMRNIIPGPGIGGSCLPKDTRAFSLSAKKMGSNLEILKASIEADTHHRDKIFAHLCRLINNNLEGKTIGILGLSFKANTDDIRCSPALDIIEKLLLNKAFVKAYDPKAMEQMKNVFPNIMYCDTAYDAIKDTDALLLLTDWNEFKFLDFELVAKLMKKRLVMDTRNIWSPLVLVNNGFNFINLGRFQ